MSLKRFPENDCALKTSSFLQEQAGVPLSNSELKPNSSLKFTAPTPIPPRKGKNLVALAVIAAFGYGAHSVWTTYFRYDAYGVVSANIVGVYAPYEGTVSSILTSEGQYVQKNDVIGYITNTDHSRELEKILDEIQLTRSEIESRQSEIAWRKGANNESYFKAQGEMLSTEGSLNELRANLTLLVANEKRMRDLQKDGAVSVGELDRATSELAATKALITAREKTLVSMKDRLEKSRSLVDDNGDNQLNPLRERLTYLENEKNRIQEKIAEGTIHSPVSGIVSSIVSHAGERVSSDHILSIVEDNTASLVLYYDPNARAPVIGDAITIWIPSMGKEVVGVVSGLSRDTVDAPTQIQKNYPANTNLVRVYLNAMEVDLNDFIVGSVIKQPSILDKVVDYTYLTKWLMDSRIIPEAVAKATSNEGE